MDEVSPEVKEEELVKVGGDIWDKAKYPERAAWEVAVVRAARAVRYAEMFPNLVGPNDIKYQTVDWQYLNEGLAAVRKPDKVIL